MPSSTQASRSIGLCRNRLRQYSQPHILAPKGTDGVTLPGRTSAVGRGDPVGGSVAVRNSIAHWEANFILEVSVLEPWESPIALTPHHLDVRAQADTRGATTNTLNQTAEEFLALANRLLRFVAPHFSDKALRATNLPRRLLLYLENNRNDVPNAAAVTISAASR